MKGIKHIDVGSWVFDWLHHFTWLAIGWVRIGRKPLSEPTSSWTTIYRDTIQTETRVNRISTQDKNGWNIIFFGFGQISILKF